MLRQPLLVLVCVAAGFACAGSSHGSQDASRCVMQPGDSVFLKHGPVYRECAVDQRATLVTRANPDFHPVSHSSEACYSAEVEFAVNTAGMAEPDDAQVLRTNDPSFADAVIASLPRWHYKPALLHGVAVRQIVKEKVGVAMVVVAVPAGQTPRPPAHGPTC